MKANINILGEVERLDDSPFRYFLGELYGDNSLGTMLPFGLPSPACDSNVPSSGPLSVTHCGLLPCITGIRAAAASPASCCSPLAASELSFFSVSKYIIE